MYVVITAVEDDTTVEVVSTLNETVLVNGNAYNSSETLAKFESLEITHSIELIGSQVFIYIYLYNV